MQKNLDFAASKSNPKRPILSRSVLPLEVLKGKNTSCGWKIRRPRNRLGSIWLDFVVAVAVVVLASSGTGGLTGDVGPNNYGRRQLKIKMIVMRNEAPKI